MGFCFLLLDMWPKNSCSLQIRVIICVMLLVGVRVLNVFVPLLTKEISKYLRPIKYGSKQVTKVSDFSVCNYYVPYYFS